MSTRHPENRPPLRREERDALVERVMASHAADTATRTRLAGRRAGLVVATVILVALALWLWSAS